MIFIEWPFHRHINCPAASTLCKTKQERTPSLFGPICLSNQPVSCNQTFVNSTTWARWRFLLFHFNLPLTTNRSKSSQLLTASLNARNTFTDTCQRRLCLRERSAPFVFLLSFFFPFLFFCIPEHQQRTFKA